jgi:hypothetical protein
VWLILEDCHELIDALPVLVGDEEKDGDIVKTESIEDDVADCARYGMKSMAAPRAKPEAEAREELLERYDSEIERIRKLRARRERDQS